MSAAGRGRPLRFMGAVALGWVGLRIAMLAPASAPAPQPTPPRKPARLQTLQAQAAPGALPAAGVSAPSGATMHRHLPRAAALPMQLVAPAAYPLPPAPDEPAPAFPVEALRTASVQALATSVSPTPLPARDHWQASTWLVLRPGRGIGVAPGAGQLGGSQYGARVAYGLGTRRKLALYGRVAGPMQGRGAEASLGLDWQPLGTGLRLAVEHRLGLDGGRGGPAIGLIAGKDAPIALGFRLEAYGQAGAIRRGETEGYAVGAVRLTGEIARRRTVRLELGAGAWGAAQREAQRLDVGPTLIATLPIGATPVRLSLDWRQRIAGSARPGSGVALSLGSDF